MGGDLRLDLLFLSNLKTRKLMRRLGEHGVVCLLRLWCYVGDHHPKGILHELGENDIEDIAEWNGERGAFTSYLLDARWLDRSQNGALIVHDWKEHQRFIYFAPERRQQSRKANDARWHKKRGVNPDRIPEMQNQESPASASASVSEDQKKDPAAEASGLPSVYQGGKGNGQDRQARKPGRCRKKEHPPEALRVYGYYCEVIANIPAKKADSLRNIAARLKEGFTEQQLGDAVARYAEDCNQKKIPSDRRYHPNNFFGTKAYLAGYLPENAPADVQKEAVFNA